MPVRFIEAVWRLLKHLQRGHLLYADLEGTYGLEFNHAGTAFRAVYENVDSTGIYRVFLIRPHEGCYCRAGRRR